jgi:hypothetical protein
MYSNWMLGGTGWMDLDLVGCNTSGVIVTK